MVSRTTRLGAKPAGKSPISSHPAFTAIVATWFAALLGIGSLIVPVILFERIFANTGLTGLLPATQAPLGVTARIIIALAAACIGVAIGLLLARKVASAQSVAQTTARPNRRGSRVAQSQRPISALEELGSESLDHPFDDNAPDYPAPDHEYGLADQPADYEIEAEEREAVLVDQTDEIATFEETSSAADFAEPATTESEHSEPVECTPALAEVQQEPEDADSLPDAAPALHAGMTAEQLISRPLEELGIVQLVERFALSLQQRPAMASFKQDLPSLPDALRPVEYGDTWDDSFDEEEEDGDVADSLEDEDYSSLLGLGKAITMRRKSFTLPEDEAAVAAEISARENESGNNRFSGPVAVPHTETPSNAAANSADTERALRDALEKLQKISGVG